MLASRPAALVYSKSNLLARPNEFTNNGQEVLASIRAALERPTSRIAPNDYNGAEQVQRLQPIPLSLRLTHRAVTHEFSLYRRYTSPRFYCPSLNPPNRFLALGPAQLVGRSNLYYAKRLAYANANAAQDPIWIIIVKYPKLAGSWAA